MGITLRATEILKLGDKEVSELGLSDIFFGSYNDSIPEGEVLGEGYPQEIARRTKYGTWPGNTDEIVFGCLEVKGIIFLTEIDFLYGSVDGIGDGNFEEASLGESI